MPTAGLRIRPLFPDGTGCSSMSFSFVPSFGTACSGHVTVPHTTSIVWAFEEHPVFAKVKFPECYRIDLQVAWHLINSCGRPGWTGTKRGPNMNAHRIDSQTTTVHAAPGAGVFANAENRAGLITSGNHEQVDGWNRLTDTRPSYPHTLFNKSPLQLRRIGALGGKAYARSQRARRALVTTPPAPIPLHAAPRQTTAEAIKSSS
jgi:hypothetical protein